MGEKVLPRGGLLSGGIGGAAQGILDVAKLSLEERAQTRKEELAAKVALYKASQKKTGSGDDKPKWTDTEVDIYDDAGNILGNRKVLYDPTNPSNTRQLFTPAEKSKFGDAVMNLHNQGFSDAEIETMILNDPDASKSYQEGLAYTIITDAGKTPNRPRKPKAELDVTTESMSDQYKKSNLDGGTTQKTPKMTPEQITAQNKKSLEGMNLR